MISNLNRQAKKLPSRLCAGCKKRFKPNRKNQRYHGAQCRYLRFAAHTTRIRVHTDDAPALLFSVNASNQRQPLAYFPVRADAETYAQFMRRCQRRQALPGARIRYSIRSTLVKNPSA